MPRFELPRPGSLLVGEVRPGDGPTVVLLHAGVADRRSWGEVVPLLPPVPVVSYDRRGFGESPLRDEPFRHVDDLLAVLDAHADGPVWLVGASMGGGLAVDAALTAPDRVAGLVLIAPAVSGAPEPEDLDPATQAVADRIGAADGDLDAVNALEVELWLDGPTGGAGRVGGAARELALSMNAIALRSGAEDGTGASGVEDAFDRLGELRVPVTVACGDLDVPFLVEQCRAVAAALPHGTHVVLPGVAHLPMLEQPQAVAALVAQALGTT